MANKIIVSVTKTHYNILLLKNNEIVEYHQEKKNAKYIVGDVFLGEVKKILPSFNVAFIDIGHTKDAFLHYSDLSPAMRSMNLFMQQIKKKTRDLDITKMDLLPVTDKDGNIADVLKKGQLLPVQILKEQIHSKGLRVTSLLTLPGRFLVLVPFEEEVTLSKKLVERQERARLRKLVRSIKPKNFGIIARTVAASKDVAILDRDLQYLKEKWDQAVNILPNAKKGRRLVAELRAVASILRDIFDEEFDKIIIDDKKTYTEIKSYTKKLFPEREKVAYLYQGEKNIFQYLNIHHKLESSLGKIVGIAGGGYIIIQQTEALCAIDVNTGSFEGENQASIALDVNIAAAKEIAKQLRLRDLGGIVAIDFVSMTNDQDKKAVLQTMRSCLKEDPAKTRVLPLNSLCVLMLTRSRVRPAISIDNNETCPTCYGSGKIQPSLSMISLLEEQLKQILLKRKLRNITICVHPYLHAYLNQSLSAKGEDIFSNYAKWIDVVADRSLAITDYRILDKDRQLISTNPKLSKFFKKK